MRTHGWGGVAPHSDEDAIERILDAAVKVIAERGEHMRVVDVARKLQVSRQTVYSYFPGANTLEAAVAQRSGQCFLRQLAAHVAEIRDPVDALVESLAYTLEWLPKDRPFQLLLIRAPRDVSAGMMSTKAREFCGEVLRGLDVDWAATVKGYDDLWFDDLVEYMLRTLQSLITHPEDLHRGASSLRAHLYRWVARVLLAEILGSGEV